MSYAARHTAKSQQSQAAQDWAAKRRAAMEKAKRLREERRRGMVSDDHTFKPACVSPRRARRLRSPLLGVSWWWQWRWWWSVYRAHVDTREERCACVIRKTVGDH